jgi:hypothetical protein
VQCHGCAAPLPQTQNPGGLADLAARWHNLYVARSDVKFAGAAPARSGFGRLASFARKRVVGALVLAIVGEYFAVCLARPDHEPSSVYPLYAQLTDAFLAGTTSLPVEPDPHLLALPNPYRPNAPYRLHDASLYKGKYYLYFGPTPVLILFLPFKLVTGAELPGRVAVPLFCSLGFLCSCGVFYVLIRRAGWSCRLWLEILVILALGNTQLVCFLLVRAAVYEAAISSGYFLVMAGFLLAAWSLGVRKRLWFVFLSGLCFGLAVGCRPHFALLAILMTAFIALHFRQSVATFSLFVAPILVAGALLAAYNYVRFDNPIEFGVTYQLSGNPEGPSTHLKASNFFPGIEHLLLLPPALNTEFPYLHPVFASPYLSYRSSPEGPDDIFREAQIGLFAAAPLTIFGLLWFWLLPVVPGNSEGAGFTIWLIRTMVLCALAVVCLLSLTGWAVGRYEVDFAPLMILASCCVVAGVWQKGGISASRRKLLRWCVLACVAWSVLLNVAIESPRLDLIRQFLEH